MAGEENTASDLITYNELVLLDREFIPPLRLINGVVSLVPPLTEPALLIFTQQTPHFDSNYFSVDKIYNKISSSRLQKNKLKLFLNLYIDKVLAAKEQQEQQEQQ